MKGKLVISSFVLLATTACTNSIDARYDAGMELDDNRLSGETLAVHEFEDERALISPDHEKAESFVARQGAWKIGLKYEGEALPPVSTVLQDAFISEFEAVGVNAVEGATAPDDAYSLDGEILEFGFNNDAGVVTVESSRRVSLKLTLADGSGEPLFNERVFNSSDRENEGMAVAHSTNVEKLMSGRLKEVIETVVKRTNQELALRGVELHRITVNGHVLGKRFAALDRVAPLSD